MSNIADPNDKPLMKKIMIGLALGGLAFGVAACDEAGEGEGQAPAPGQEQGATPPASPPPQ